MILFIRLSPAQFSSISLVKPKNTVIMATTQAMAKIQQILEREDGARLLGIVGVTAAILAWALHQYLTASDLSFLPRAGKKPGVLGFGLTDVKRDFAKNGTKIINEGYRNNKDGMFLVQTLNVERVVLSPKYIEEINNKVPEGTLDMVEGLRERLLSAQTNLDVVFRSPLHIDVCKDQLTRNLHHLIAPLNDEANHTLSKLIPHKVELKAYDTMVGIITKNASRMFGGTTISRNEEWLKSAADYSMDVVSVAVKLRPYPAFLRPLIYPFLGGSKILDNHLRIAKKTFSHIFAERLALADGDEKPVDMLQWLADSARGSDRDPDVLAHNMLFMALASVHTSSATIIHVLFDLCANPQFTDELRQDVQQAITESGWTLAAIARMKKLDSFMKESQRMNQAVLMTFNRKLAKSLKFEDGTTLPAGTYITMPSHAVATDPDIYANPEKFDGYRFYDKRMSAKTEANRHQFATTGPESLAFGQGKTACPGRFFAASNIKVVLANLLLNYEVSFPAGQTERPRNLHKGGLVRPDPRQTLIFSPRK
ncbi:cytochrome P450 [Xylaria nigripes]|nr:cytochrome P450 [Xylaria nigripes]